MDENEKRIFGVLPPMTESDKRVLGPFLIVLGAFAMVLLLFGVTVVNFFGQRCFLIGSAPNGQCLPDPVYFGAWLAAIALCVGGTVMLSLRQAGSSAETKHRERDVGEPTTIPNALFDRTKWNALLKYDPELAIVADKLRPLGQKWVDEFAAAYLAINEKSYLPSIISKIIADARKEDERQQRKQ
jgi:hypothetical protein